VRPRTLSRLSRSRHGAIAILFALLVPVVLGVVGLGVEIGLWYLRQRDMQNAADASVLAASVNSGTTFATEGAQVAARYGYTGPAVNIVENQPCPPSAGRFAGTNTCYRSTVRSGLELLLAPATGFLGQSTCATGDTVCEEMRAHTSRFVMLSAAAMATKTEIHHYCILALTTSGTGIDGRGSPDADLGNCSIMSNADARCAGHDLNAFYGDAAGTNVGCGVNRQSSIPPVTDPYAALRTNIPVGAGCVDYHYVPTHRNDPPLPAENQLAGEQTWNAPQVYCGDVQLAGNVTVAGGTEATLVIVNGQLDLNGHTLQTASGAGLTIIFTGDGSSGTAYAPTGGGGLDIAAPTSGTWKGMAIYQDPLLTHGVDIAAAGNSPLWSITGIVYLPNADVEFRGAVSKATYGASCFGMVAKSIDIRGTAAIYPIFQGECDAASIALPKTIFRGKLVQ
jgi:hypothetical protein